MVDITKLSDEELNALESEQASGPDITSLSDEELAALESEVSAEEGPSKMESAAMGAVQGLTANYADEIIGVGKAVGEIGSSYINALGGVPVENSLSDFSTIYRKKQKEAELMFEKAAQANPISYYGGEAAGGTAAMAAVAAVNPVGATLAATIRGGALLGGLSAVGSAPGGSDATELAKRGATGAALGAAGAKLGEIAGKKVSGFLAKRAAEKQAEITGKTVYAARGALGIKTSNDIAKLNKMLVRTNTSPEEYTSIVTKHIPFTEETTRMQTLDKLVLEKHNIWDNLIQPVHNQIDDAVPEGIVDVTKLVKDVIDEADFELDGLADEQVQKYMQKAMGEFELYNSKPTATLKELQLLKNRITSKWNPGSDSNKNSIYGAMTRVITKTQREAVESSDSIVANILEGGVDEYKNRMKSYGILAESEGFARKAAMDEEAAIQKAGAAVYSLKNKISNIVNVPAMRNVVGEYIKKPSSILTEFGEVVKSSAYDFNDVSYLASLMQLSTSAELNPGRYNKLINNVVLSSTRSIDDFVNELGYADSVVYLDSDPIQPSMDDINKKSPKILNILNKTNPQLATAFESALQSGDKATMGKMMSSLRDLPEASRFFAPGIGIDGQLFTEADKIKAKKMLPPTLGTVQRMRAMEQINSGTLPILEQEKKFTPEKIIKKRTENGQKKVDF